MKKLAFASLLVVAAISPFLSFGAECVYLKPLGSSEERTTQDGESWTTAYADPATAIAAAASAGKPVYAAQGVYNVPATISIGGALDIYGGFAGVSMEETVDSRNPAVCQTIFTGDTGLDDVWMHYAPNASFGFDKTDLAEPVIKNGKINEPPDFTADYDGYGQSVKGTNGQRCLDISNGAGVIDGIVFSGFYFSTGDGSVVKVTVASGKTLVFSNCRFVANGSRTGNIEGSSEGISVKCCRFEYCFGDYRSSAITEHGGNTIAVSDCLFRCISRPSANGGNVLYGWFGGFTVRNSTFERCAQASGESWWYQPTYGGAGAIHFSERNKMADFYDCAFSNNYCATSYAYGPTFFCTPMRMKRCVFSHNCAECSPVQGSVYALISANTIEGLASRSFEGCAFEGNVMRARTVVAESGDYVLGLIGNGKQGSGSSLLNCSFKDNVAETLVEKDGVTPILCRGVVANAPVAGKVDQSALANCTFYGEDNELYDIVQYGGNHSKDLNVVNCIFETAGDAHRNPIFAISPSYLKLYSCSVLNKFTTEGGAATYEGLRYDKIPLVWQSVDAAVGRSALVPDAKVPGLYETCMVATNSDEWSWAFKRPADGAKWEALAPALAALKSGVTFTDRLVTDAAGVARPEGAFARGVMQTLTDRAENGKSLVLRREPAAAGSFDGPGTQSVADGDPIVAVTAKSTDEETYVFDGWYDAKGVKVSDSAKLTSAELDADITLLTAKFAAKPVSITFDLGECGVFESTQTPTVTCEYLAGSVFPSDDELPARRYDASWKFLGFNTPTLIPETNATYHARYVTTAVRVIRVTPEGAGRRDGTDWENAYGDLAAAVADAGIHRGEVWAKKGCYVLKEAVRILPNVTVRGGFAGNETTADAADPKLNQTILTGDVKGDNYWLPDGVNQGQTGYEVWTQDEDGEWVFNEPNPDYANKYWKPSGNNSDDAASAFVNTVGCATNVCFEGLVFTGFKGSAIVSSTEQANGLRFSRCRFLACDTGVSSDYAFNINGSSFVVEDCEFNGCWAAAYFTAPAATTGVFVNTAFKNCAKDAWGTAALKADGRAVIAATNCWFYRGWVSQEHQQAASAFTTAASGGLHQFYKCTFEENYSTGHARGTVVIQGDSGICFDKCRFLRNRNENTDAYADLHSACIAYGQSKTPDSFCRDCFFEGNYASSTANGTANYVSSILSARGAVTFSNCTILNSTNEISGADCPAGTFALRGASIGLVNCVVKDTANLTANSAEITVTGTPSVGIINSVLTSKEPNYRALRPLDSTLPPTMANSYLQDFEVATCAGTQNAYFYGVVTNGDPCVKGKVEEKDGVFALGVGAGCKVRMRPVWLANDNTAWFFDPVASQSSPWRKVTQRTLFKRESEVVSLGLDKQNPVLPDAFGASRTIRKDGFGRVPGPLEGDALGLVIFFH